MGRAGALLLAPLVLAVSLAGAAAQAPESATPGTGPALLPAPIATLDFEQLFDRTAYGQAIHRRFEAELSVLASENRIIEAELSKREQELTTLRPTLPAEEFRKLADAFNTEVEEHRHAQQAKEEAIYFRHDSTRNAFRQAVNPVLADLMVERGIVAIIAEEAIVLGFRQIDLTAAAIERVNARLGDGPPPEDGTDDPTPPAD